MPDGIDVRRRYWMRAATSISADGTGRTSRNITLADGERLGELMYLSYRGGIDDNGKSLAGHIAEAVATLDGKHGDMLFAASHVIEENGQFISASVATHFEGEPLIALVLTRPEARRRGYAAQLVRQSLSSLAAQGHDTAKLIVTAGNDDAERLYRKLGFLPLPA